MTGMALQTMKKLTSALDAIRAYSISPFGPDAAGKLNLIHVITNETLKEVEPEIAAIKLDAEQYAAPAVTRP
jgi:hypothetical protein